MQVSAILLARLFAFLHVEDLNPRGKVLLPELTKALAGRYAFAKYPEKSDEYDTTKGVEFSLGRWGEQTIEKVVIFSNGIVVDTRSSTDDSEKILEEALTWAADRLGLNYRPGMAKRKVFLSQVTFTTDLRLNGLNSKLNGFEDRISKIVSNQLGQDLKFEVSGLSFSFDPTSTKVPLSSVLIERRAEVPFSENKYFSQAPLPTQEHIKLLEDFEAALRAS